MPGRTRRPTLLDDQLTLDPDLAPIPSPDGSLPDFTPLDLSLDTPYLDLLPRDPSTLGPMPFDLLPGVGPAPGGLDFGLEGTFLEGIAGDVEAWSRDPMGWTMAQDTLVNRQQADFDASIAEEEDRFFRSTGDPGGAAEAYSVTGGSVPVYSW